MGTKLPIITLRPTSHEEIVARYIMEKRSQAVKEREYYAGLTTREGARQAALAITPESGTLTKVPFAFDRTRSSNGQRRFSHTWSG